ncbi:cytochrome c oxidase subunit 3 [Sanyastnella coralliicola]|uniref:cytochrome c oxidase subunit 3 n=1 Tax=Sanyastnella coralliicola TaxID=3069118 RepID=UPI0027BAEB95|nr:cytochrome c oxidase subunit 3 [Longitalea sp. SCSIO 12813]
MAGEATKEIPKEVLWGGGRSPFSVSYGKMMMWYFLVSDALTFGGLLTAYGFIRHGSESPWPIGEQVFEALPGLEGQYPLAYVALMTFILIVSSVTMVLGVEAGHRNDKKGVIKWLGWTIVGGFIFLGSQAWEWSHFIHGSGGAFQLSENVTVTGTLANGETMQFDMLAGDRVYMDHHFGNIMEEYVEGAPNVSVTTAGGSVTAMSLGAHSHEATLEYLTVNKYIENRATVEGAEMMKLWNARSSDQFVFGANLSENEYGVQQQYSNFFFFITGFHGFHVFSGVVINIIIWLLVIQGVYEKRGHYEMVEKIGLYWHFVDLVWVFVFTFFYLV